MRLRLCATVLVAITILTIAGCAKQPHVASYGAPGFLLGLFHGAVAPLALVVGFFGDARVYAFPNTGWFYDLGFILGLSAWAGGGAAATK